MYIIRGNMSEYCYDDQLSTIIGALQDQDIRLLQISASLIEITAFLDEFKKNWGEPSWMEVPLNDEGKLSTQRWAEWRSKFFGSHDREAIKILNGTETDTMIEEAASKIAGHEREIIDLFCKTFIAAKTLDMPGGVESAREWIVDLMKSNKLSLVQKQSELPGETFGWTMSIEFNPQT